MRSKTNIVFILMLIMLSSIAILPARAADETVSTCGLASFTTAMGIVNTGAGGTIDFTCSGTITFTSTFTITTDVEITGVGQTIVLDGGGNRLFSVDPGATLILRNLTIQNGNDTSGGAIRNSGMVQAIIVTFDNNSASGAGGAIYNGGSVIVLSSTFSNNSANSGAAIENYGSVNINTTTFSNNTGVLSGAIYHGGTDMILNASSFTDNEATGGDGGAIKIGASSTITMNLGTLDGNSASGAGGAIYNAGDATFSNNTFTDNTANGAGAQGGGAIFNNGTSLTVFGALFSNNRATAGYGGGIHLFQSPANITNTTFMGNSATSGGGLHNNGTGTNLVMQNVTFSNNVTTLAGAGAALWNSLAIAASSLNGTFINNACGGSPVGDLGGNNSDAASIGCPDTAGAPEPVAPEITTSTVTVLGCALDTTDGVEVAGAPDNTYCRVLMKNGGVVSYSGAIPSQLVGLGVQLAVDVYRLEGGASVNTFPNYSRVCLAGTGRLFYMDARQAPRVVLELASEVVDGLTCGWIPAPGTLILTN